MNTKALKSTIDWRQTGIIKGIKVKQIPVEGNAVYYGIGSDCYGYQIGKVDEDGLGFEILNERGQSAGRAMLITRKNSQLCGWYVKVGYDGRPDVWRCRGRLHGALSVTQEQGCGETYLDPSF